MASGGPNGPLPGGVAFDLWLVPVPEAGTSMVVFDPVGGSPSQQRRGEWQQIVDSLEITVEKS